MNPEMLGLLIKLFQVVLRQDCVLNNMKRKSKKKTFLLYLILSTAQAQALQRICTITERSKLMYPVTVDYTNFCGKEIFVC